MNNTSESISDFANDFDRLRTAWYQAQGVEEGAIGANVEREIGKLMMRDGGAFAMRMLRLFHAVHHTAAHGDLLLDLDNGLREDLVKWIRAEPRHSVEYILGKLREVGMEGK